MNPEDYNLLNAGLCALHVHPDESAMEKLQLHLEEIHKWNRRFNLVRAGVRDLVVKHLLDSLSGLQLIENLPGTETLADVGSGGGFPGIPLAVILKEKNFGLIERKAKRAAFLRNVCLLAGLENIRVREENLSDTNPAFDVVLFRGFSSLPECLDGIFRIVRPGGTVIAYKGRRKNIDSELSRLTLPVEEIRVQSVCIPFLGEERHLVILKKPLSRP